MRNAEPLLPESLSLCLPYFSPSYVLAPRASIYFNDRLIHYVRSGFLLVIKDLKSEGMAGVAYATTQIILRDTSTPGFQYTVAFRYPDIIYV